jgi:hypothetical protein
MNCDNGVWQCYSKTEGMGRLIKLRPYIRCTTRDTSDPYMEDIIFNPDACWADLQEVMCDYSGSTMQGTRESLPEVWLLPAMDCATAIATFIGFHAWPAKDYGMLSLRSFLRPTDHRFCWHLEAETGGKTSLVMCMKRFEHMCVVLFDKAFRGVTEDLRELLLVPRARVSDGLLRYYLEEAISLWSAAMLTSGVVQRYPEYARTTPASSAALLKRYLRQVVDMTGVVAVPGVPLVEAHPHTAFFGPHGPFQAVKNRDVGVKLYTCPASYAAKGGAAIAAPTGAGTGGVTSATKPQGQPHMCMWKLCELFHVLPTGGDGSTIHPLRCRREAQDLCPSFHAFTKEEAPALLTRECWRTWPKGQGYRNQIATALQVDVSAW